MSSAPDYQLHTFSNGIRWVHKQVKSTKISHCGIMLDIGSRDEKENEIGIAHFWEHMAFKGTKTHNSNYILNRIDKVGGELNAYTTKEKICFHASILSKHTEKAIELLSDITFNSTFPAKEIEKERQVILEEMTMYEDNPDDAIQDDFDTVLFGKHPFGNNILGTKKSVSKFEQKDFLKFIDQNLNTNKLIISTVSNKSMASLMPLMDKYFLPIPSKTIERKRVAPTVAQKTRLLVKKPINQAHVMMGAEAFNIFSANRLPFFLLVNVLGGPAMNSKLNMAVRERHGLVYNIDAQYNSYLDCGVFNIYFGTEKKNIEKAFSLIWKELNKLKENALSVPALKAAKEQLKGQLAMSEENNNGIMLMMAKSILDLNSIESIDSIFSKIDSISAETLKSLANEVFVEEKMNYLIFEPEK